MSKFILLLALVAFAAAAPAPLPEAAPEAAPEPLPEANPEPEPAPAPAPAPAPVEVAENEEKKAEIISILKSESNQHDDGSYSFLFESADGSSRQEKAIIENAGTDEEAIKITGSYKYTDANGEEVLVTYTADENGFVPVGSIIPKEISDTALAAKDLPKLEDKEENESGD